MSALCVGSCSAWFELACSGRILDQSRKVHDVILTVGGHRVCAAAWAAMRGIPPATATTIVRRVWAGAACAREWLESYGIHESCSESLVLGKTRTRIPSLEQDSTSNPGGQGFKGFVNLGLESRPPVATLIRPN